MEAGKPKQAVLDEVNEDALQKEEPEGENRARGIVIHVNPAAKAGGAVADDRLRHAVHTDWHAGQRILQQANGRTGSGAGDRIATADGKKERNDQRQIEDSEA